jgi:phytoene desaturase
MNKKNIVVIGSGFSGLSAASHLAKFGHSVTIFEKNDRIGGRAGKLVVDDFTFDMGPTWYWMPDVFEHFFADFGRSVKDFYEPIRLDPGYQVYFGKDESLHINADFEKIKATFEKEEPGSGAVLEKFMKNAEYNYRVAMDKVVHKPGKSPLELVMPATIGRVNYFMKSISSLVRQKINSDKLAQILEFPVLFLGAKPTNTPAFYSFMNYADMKLGTWYVKGGMATVVQSFADLATSLGVTIQTNSPVEKIIVHNNKVTGVQVGGEIIQTDLVITGADYAHSETLLDEQYRNYSEDYWKKKTFAPSALMYYVGFNKKLKNVEHHTLFFDTSFKRHAEKIYDDPQWPDSPLFYASFPSITDDSIAPTGQEAAIFLIPIAPGLSSDGDVKERYFNEIISRMEVMTDQSLKDSILFQKSYSVEDFSRDYNAYNGNAYGLANTLLQTAFLKPKLENKKVPNLLYAGQLTVPGPGVPPTIISGKIAAQLALKKL